MAIRWLTALRWVFVLPLFLALAYLIYFVGGTLINYGMMQYLGSMPRGWLRAVSETFANGLLGAGFTFAAVRIAPSAPRAVAATAFGLVLSFCVYSGWWSFRIGMFDALPSIGAAILGSAAATVGAFRGGVSPITGARKHRETGPSE